jgi:hypothetical protein
VPRCWEWWHKTVILALRRLRQEDGELTDQPRLHRAGEEGRGREVFGKEIDTRTVWNFK